MQDGLDGPAPLYLARVAARAQVAVDVDDVAVTRFAAPDRWDVVHATDDVVAELEQLVFTVGEGPTWDAVRRRQAVVVPDLTTALAAPAWPLWSPAAVAHGYGAVAVVPVQVGIVTLGALSLYRKRRRRFTELQVERAAELSDAVLLGLLEELTADADAPALEEFFSARVYQASGMVMVQLGLDATHALLALRAHAFASGRTLVDVSDDVVARRLRLSVEGDPA